MASNCRLQLGSRKINLIFADNVFSIMPTTSAQCSGSNIASPHSKIAIPLWLLSIVIVVGVIIAFVVHFKTAPTGIDQMQGTQALGNALSAPPATKQVFAGPPNKSVPQTELQSTKQLVTPSASVTVRPPIPGDLADAIRFAKERAVATGTSTRNADTKPPTSFLEAIRAAQERQNADSESPNATVLPFSRSGQ